jgi:hypothetical protein
MTPPDDVTIIVFDPHVVWALAAIVLALVIVALLIAERQGKRK